jgi:hypothetical protein
MYIFDTMISRKRSVPRVGLDLHLEAAYQNRHPTGKC